MIGAKQEHLTALVLGASLDESRPNIGNAISEELISSFIVVHEDDCAKIDLETGKVSYDPPDMAWDNYDILVVTLGTTHMAPFGEVGQEDFHKVLYGSLELPLECARRYVRARTELAKRSIVSGWRSGSRHSTILFIGSYAHDHPFTHCTSYCTAKAGLDMAVRCLAWELMPEGFDVHIVHPFHVQGTPMTEVVRRGMREGVHHMSEKDADAYQRKDLRMPDLLTPPEIGGIVKFLVTDPNARWLSGTSVKMYGGTR